METPNKSMERSHVKSHINFKKKTRRYIPSIDGAIQDVCPGLGIESAAWSLSHKTDFLPSALAVLEETDTLLQEDVHIAREG